jgi:hypothetical protein
VLEISIYLAPFPEIFQIIHSAQYPYGMPAYPVPAYAGIYNNMLKIIQEFGISLLTEYQHQGMNVNTERDWSFLRLCIFFIKFG